MDALDDLDDNPSFNRYLGNASESKYGGDGMRRWNGHGSPDEKEESWEDSGHY